MANWWQSDPVQNRQEGASQPLQATNFWDKDITATQQAESLVGRFGKQIYNEFAQVPERTAESVMKLGKLGVPSVEKREAWLQKQAAKGKRGAAKQLQRFMETGGEPKFKPAAELYALPEAKTLAEKGVDIGARITSTVAQLALLRKMFPTYSEPVIWEMQNLMTGGKPGMGAAMGATIGIGGKLGKTGLEKATAEAAGVYVVQRVGGATPKEAAAMAAVPVAFRGAKALKAKIKPKAIPSQPITKVEANDTVNELVSGLKTAKRVERGIVRQAYRAEHAKRAVSAESLKEEMIAKGMPVGEALVKSRAALKGPLMENIPTYEAPKLTTTQWESISQKIDDIFEGKYYSKTRSQTGLNKLKKGVPLQNNEIELLGKILGPDFVSAAEKLQSPVARTWRIIEDIANLPKAAASFDVQMRRQSRWLKGRHPVLRWRAIGHNIGGYFSKKWADKVQREIESSPFHQDAIKAGTVFWGPGATLGARPEQFRTRLLAKVPGVRKFYGASERGFGTSFNWIQQKLYDLKMEQFTREGVDITPIMKRQVAEFNNTIMGMFKAPSGSRLGTIQRVLTPVMWSPTLTYSRVRTPSMLFTNPTMRAETAATLSSYVGVTLLQLAAMQRFGKMLGFPVDVEWNPKSTDFGKARIGNTRFDMFGDGGPYIRMLAQFITGQKKTQTGKIIEQPRLQAVWNVARNKRSPWIDALYSFISGKTPYGSDYWTLPEGIDIKSKSGRVAFFGGREVVNRALPFFLQSMIEAAYNDGWPTGLLALTDEFFSGAVTSYKPTKATRLQNLKDLIADIQYKQPWDDLTIQQQNQLRLQFKTELEQAETKVKVERAGRKEPPLGSLKQQMQAEQNILSSLSNTNRQLLKDTGTSAQISRTIGKFWLNDTRYKRYQELTAQYIEQSLTRLQASPAFTFRRNDKIIQMAVDRSRELARLKLMQEIRQK